MVLNRRYRVLYATKDNHTMAKVVEKKLPTHIEEVDALRYEKLALQLQNLDMQATMLKAQMQALVEGWNAQYTITKDDTIDLSTREIKRVKQEVATSDK